MALGPSPAAENAKRVVDRRVIVSIKDGVRGRRQDALVAEEPMEIRVNGEPVAVTMRTPGSDFELATGFCLTEGIIDDPADVVAIRYCAGSDRDSLEPNPYNIVDVDRRDPTPVASALQRNVYTTSSCGLCGTASIDAVRKRVRDVSGDSTRVTADLLSSLPDRLRAAQRVFERTGGLHAAAIFTPDGELRCIREDVGRHNAVDKVIGWAAQAGLLPLSGHVLMVSGRVAFELAQKALIAGLPLLVAVSAPSSLAVELADAAGMTVVGFLRGRSMNVYTHAERVYLTEPVRSAGS